MQAIRTLVEWSAGGVMICAALVVLGALLKPRPARNPQHEATMRRIHEQRLKERAQQPPGPVEAWLIVMRESRR